MIIRAAADADWEQIWPFFHEIVVAGETYSYDRDLTFEQGRAMWMMDSPASRVALARAARSAGRTVVAVDEAGTVLGSAKMGRNQMGPASHVANGSFMVDPAHSGKGVGRALGQYIVDQARADGFRAMVFNAVVSSNTSAVRLWQRLGFEIVATIPDGFAHPSLGFVGLHIMYRKL